MAAGLIGRAAPWLILVLALVAAGYYVRDLSADRDALQARLDTLAEAGKIEEARRKAEREDLIRAADRAAERAAEAVAAAEGVETVIVRRVPVPGGVCQPGNSPDPGPDASEAPRLPSADLGGLDPAAPACVSTAGDLLAFKDRADRLIAHCRVIAARHAELWRLAAASPCFKE